MTPEKETLAIIQASIAQLSPAEQQGVSILADYIRIMLKVHHKMGNIALALVGAEQAAKV